MATSIAELQTIQHKIAEMELLLLQTRTLLYSTLEQWLEEPERRGELGRQLVAVPSTPLPTPPLRVTDLALWVAVLRRPVQRLSAATLPPDARIGPGPPRRWKTPCSP